MKVYCVHDGRYRFMVAAANQKDAANRLQTTVHSLRKYGERVLPADAEVALSEPGRVWKKKIATAPGTEPWLYAWASPPADRPA